MFLLQEVLLVHGFVLYFINKNVTNEKLEWNVCVKIPQILICSSTLIKGVKKQQRCFVLYKVNTV